MDESKTQIRTDGQSVLLQLKIIYDNLMSYKSPGEKLYFEIDTKADLSMEPFICGLVADPSGLLLPRELF